jgi:hypothetical protein
MDEKDQSSEEGAVGQYLTARMSRARLLATGAGFALAALPATAAAAAPPQSGRLEFPFFPPVKGTYTPESIQDILNILDTAERLLVAIHTAAVTTYAGQLAFSPLALSIVQASLAQEQYHVDFLESIGARGLVDSFAVRSSQITNRAVYFQAMVGVGTIYTAAYLTAAREFAEVGQPTLVKYAYQIGATKSEHGVLGRTLLALGGASSAIPPNNNAFEPDQYLYVRDFYSYLASRGYFGKNDTPVPYLGRAAALAAAGPMASAVGQTTP